MRWIFYYLNYRLFYRKSMYRTIKQLLFRFRSPLIFITQVRIIYIVWNMMQLKRKKFISLYLMLKSHEHLRCSYIGITRISYIKLYEIKSFFISTRLSWMLHPRYEKPLRIKRRTLINIHAAIKRSLLHNSDAFREDTRKIRVASEDLAAVTE